MKEREFIGAARIGWRPARPAVSGGQRLTKNRRAEQLYLPYDKLN
jgi:hypothetical protein